MSISLTNTLEKATENTGHHRKRRAAFSAKTPAANSLIGKIPNRGHGNT